MAELDNRKHEAFCQAYIFNPDTCYNGTKSYQSVYPDAKDTSAATLSYELLRNVEILERISELKSEKSKLNIHKADKLEAEFYQFAVNDECTPTERMRALENISKLNGLFVDTKKVDLNGDLLKDNKITVEIVKKS